MYKFGDSEEKIATLDEVEDMFSQAFEKLRSLEDKPEFDELIDEAEGSCTDLLDEVRRALGETEEPPFSDFFTAEEGEKEEPEEGQQL